MVDTLRPYVASDAIALSLVHTFDGVLFEALLDDEPPTVEALLPLIAAFQARRIAVSVGVVGLQSCPVVTTTAADRP